MGPKLHAKTGANGSLFGRSGPTWPSFKTSTSSQKNLCIPSSSQTRTKLELHIQHLVREMNFAAMS